jgi:hypothetical protein
MVLRLVLRHFTSWRCLNTPFIPKVGVGTSRRRNATKGPCSAIAALAEVGTFSHIFVNGSETCVGAFHLPDVIQHPLGTEGVCGHLQEMKYYNRTLFLSHCRTCQTRHLFSYMCHWFWDMCRSISPPGCASTPRRYRGGGWAPPGDEMLQQDLVLPLLHLPK